VNAVMNLWVPLDAGKVSSCYTTAGISSSAQLHRASSIASYKVAVTICDSAVG
jgi:hypothetical protein